MYTLTVQFPDGNRAQAKSNFKPYAGSQSVVIATDNGSVEIDFQTLRYMMDEIRNQARVSGKNL